MVGVVEEVDGEPRGGNTSVYEGVRPNQPPAPPLPWWATALGVMCCLAAALVVAGAILLLWQRSRRAQQPAAPAGQ